MKQIFKKSFAAFLTVCLLLSAFTVFPVFADGYNAPEQISGTFQTADSQNYIPFSYDDNVFAKSSYIYRQDLARITMRLSMAAFGNVGQNPDGTPDYSNSHQYLEAFMGKLHFSDFEKNEWYTKHPEKDSIAVGIARKQVRYPDGDYTLLAVAIRGSGYANEWGGNFEVGTDEDHEGFAIASEQVIDFLKEYQQKYDITDHVKIWVTGYSRGAAVANLTAAYLDSHVGSKEWYFYYQPEDVYSYCAGVPSPTADKERGDALYHNIFSFVNLNDLTPMVVMHGWDYGRYGIVRYAPTAFTDINYTNPAGAGLKDKMLPYYNQYYGGEYQIDSFKRYTELGEQESGFDASGIFLDRLTELLATVEKNPAYYEENLQDDLVKIGEEIVGNEKGEALGEAIKDALPAGILVFITTGSLENAVKTVLKAGFEAVDISISDKGLTEMITFFESLGIDDAITLVNNLESIGQGHYASLYLAWLDSMTEDDFLNVRIRELSVTGDADITVTDENGATVAQITEDVPKEIKGVSIPCMVDADGKKLFYLPQNATYAVTVKATQDGEITYSMQEADPTYHYKRTVSFEDISVNENDNLTGKVSKMNQTEAEYSLKQGLTPLTPTKDIRDAEPYTVALETAGKGTAEGGGTYYPGEVAKVIAKPDENETFFGWYAGNKLISSDPVYRFAVTDEIKITARFTEPMVTVEILGLSKPVSLTGMGYHGVIMIAYFDEDNTLIDVKTYQPKEQITASAPEDYKYAKVMWWNNMQEMNPICPSEKTEK